MLAGPIELPDAFAAMQSNHKQHISDDKYIFFCLFKAVKLMSTLPFPSQDVPVCEQIWENG